MASKIEALVRNFLKTDGDALYLVPGEKIFLMKGASKVIVGREPLGEESFRAVAGELVPGAPVESLSAMRHRVPFRLDEATEPVDIQFGRSGEATAIMISRARAAAPVVPIAPVAPEEPSFPPAASYSSDAPPSYQEAPRGGSASIGLPPPSLPSTPRSAPEHVEALDVPDSLSGMYKRPDFDQSQMSASTSKRRGAPVKRSGRPIDDILMKMLEVNASDVHLSTGVRPVLRVHGEMTMQEDLPILVGDAVEKMLEPILTERSRKEFAERNDVDFAYEIATVARFRVNMFRDRHGVGAVFRQIPIKILTAKQLNLPPAVVALGDLTKGLVLVTGPTGSGKSTTLAAIVDYINDTRSDHIITIEDPIEFVHENKKCLVNQREVGIHTRGFKDALRAALREDPDIVLVGEMRDLETIAIAIETAETGHLVFGTLHTTTATSTVDRIVDQFPADRQQQIRVMLADSLRGVVAQTLCKKVGGGRIAALEVLLSNNAISNLIRDGKTFQLPSVLQTSKSQGMFLLNDSLLDFVKRGLVEPREAYLKAVDKLGLLSAFKTHNIALPTAEAAAAAGPVEAVPVAPANPGGAGGAQQRGVKPAGGRADSLTGRPA
ncbi:MAG: type IV pilus twitching motility protein PilT [Thermoanaerobaculia bacterium]